MAQATPTSQQPLLFFDDPTPHAQKGSSASHGKSRRGIEDNAEDIHAPEDHNDEPNNIGNGFTNKRQRSLASRPPAKPNKRTAIEATGPNAKKQKTKVRVPGGGVPTAKRIVPDYDSEDQIIVNMKQQGYSDNDVVKRLCDEGRTKYDPKSISSRWQRIRKCLQAAEDELLDEELTDWHVEEDNLLEEAHQKAEIKLKNEIKKNQNKFFTFVAQEINKTAPRPRFSARACRERYEAKAAGNARVPPELDSDPEGRARERAERIAAFKVRKQQEVERAKQAAEEAQRDKAQNEKKQEATRKRREIRASKRKQRREEEDDFKKSKLDAIKEKRQNRKDAMNYLRAFRQYTQRKRHAEKMLYRKLQRDANARARTLTRYSLQFPLPQEAVTLSSSITMGTGQASSKKSGSRTHRDESLGAMDLAAQELALDLRNERLAATPAPGMIAKSATATGGASSKTSADDLFSEKNIYGKDPRAMLTLAELYDLMRERGMLLGRMKEVKGVVLSRIADDDKRMSHFDLQKMLRERRLSDLGSKTELIRRLQEDDAKKSSSYNRRFAIKPPVAETAAANAAAVIANGGRGRGGRVARATTATGRFSARPAPTSPGPTGKRYNARERTRHLQEVDKTASAGINSSQTRDRIAWLMKSAYTGANSARTPRGGARAGTRGGSTLGRAAVARTPLHSEVPEPTYAPTSMEDHCSEVGGDANHESSSLDSGKQDTAPELPQQNTLVSEAEDNETEEDNADDMDEDV